MLPTVTATLYVAPLREGGSLPGIVEADDLGTYVCKFRGAGQGLRVLWLDALVANVDRSWRNPNLLMWHGDLWAIDHGASLYFHHTWPQGVGSPERFARQPYDAADHVLGAYLDRVADADATLAPMVTRELLWEVVDLVPEEWVEVPPGTDDVAAVRGAYVDFLHARVSGQRSWLPGVAAA